MSAVPKTRLVSVDEYLANELVSNVKHEYLGGYVYAMAGGRNAHNQIASNVLGLCHAQLRGTKCSTFNSDTKIRIKLPSQVRMYYPDVSVVCNLNPPTDTFQDQPVVVVEVLSHSTRRNDQEEKKAAYLTIPSLVAYLTIEQEFPHVGVDTRQDQGFVHSSYSQLSDTFRLPGINLTLRLEDIYENVELIPEPSEEEP
jgi:Uma2 family endonuclease